VSQTICVFAPDEVLPSPRAVLRSQGVPAGVELPGRVTRLVDDALELYHDLARPRATWQTVDATAFAEVYEGEGRNAPDTPVAQVFPRATHLALFAATLGRELSARIDSLFVDHDLALAALLDAAASEGAELLVARLGEEFVSALGDPTLGVLAYSPGYCGWDITGQLRLFSRLRPEEIGVSVSANCLMRPLKSVSGVLAAGPPTIHQFDDRFPFCERCTTRGCRGRIAATVPEEAGHGRAPEHQ
jgi:hypothetical protein